MALLDIKSAKVTERGQIAIPKTIRKMSGFSIGSKIAILAYDDHIEIRSLDQIKESWDQESKQLSNSLKEQSVRTLKEKPKSDSFQKNLLNGKERTPLPPKPPARKRKRRSGWRFI